MLLWFGNQPPCSESWRASLSPQQTQKASALTIVQSKDYASSQESPQGLGQGINWQLDPGLPGQEAHGKSDSWVQMSTCRQASGYCTFTAEFGSQRWAKGHWFPYQCHTGKAQPSRPTQLSQVKSGPHGATTYLIPVPRSKCQASQQSRRPG